MSLKTTFYFSSGKSPLSAMLKGRHSDAVINLDFTKIQVCL